MDQIFVAAGSNLPSGEISPFRTVEGVPGALRQWGWRPLRASASYRNPAWPPGSGAPDYVNAVIQVAAAGRPEDLLADLHAIETASGRTRDVRYGSRTLDLDLVAWGDVVLPDAATVTRWIEARGDDHAAAPARLILPHPRMQERAFVLVPLAEIAPEWRHPVIGRTARELRDALPEGELAKLKPA